MDYTFIAWKICYCFDNESFCYTKPSSRSLHAISVHGSVNVRLHDSYYVVPKCLWESCLRLSIRERRLLRLPCPNRLFQWRVRPNFENPTYGQNHGCPLGIWIPWRRLHVQSLSGSRLCVPRVLSPTIKDQGLGKNTAGTLSTFFFWSSYILCNHLQKCGYNSLRRCFIICKAINLLQFVSSKNHL